MDLRGCKLAAGALALLFAWLLPGSAAQALESLPHDHPKYRVAEGVYRDLVRAVGDGRPAPAFYVQPAGARGARIAVYHPGEQAVVLEERVFDLCAGMGADSLNALAFLLGHELAHYYRDHAWGGDFGNAFADLAIAKQIGGMTPEKRAEIETEADYFGGFSGYMAGYNTLGVAPRVLEAVYQAYRLKADLKGYPSLPERQAIADSSERKLRRMAPVFDAGNCLLMLGRYGEAARCFEYIAQTFPSREILNNAGVARAMEALALFDPSEVRFAYPFEFDARTRLLGGERAKGGPDVAERRRRLLEAARAAFENATHRDPEYATAWVNLACVYDLQGEHEIAAALAGKGLRLALEQEADGTAAHARVARGIALAGSGEANAALAEFTAAEAQDGELGRINLAILERADAGFGFAEGALRVRRALRSGSETSRRHRAGRSVLRMRLSSCPGRAGGPPFGCRCGGPGRGTESRWSPAGRGCGRFSRGRAIRDGPAGASGRAARWRRCGRHTGRLRAWWLPGRGITMCTGSRRLSF